jgi:hypothetical protein
MENIAPVIGVGIDRVAFTQKKTTLVFDAGMLKSVCIYKKSELLEFVQIPLYVAQSIVLLPTRIIQVRIDQTNSQRALVQAEDELIKTQLHYLNVLREGKDPSAPGEISKVLQKRQPGKDQEDAEAAALVVPTRAALEKKVQDTFDEICPSKDRPANVGFVPLFAPATPAASPVVSPPGG